MWITAAVLAEICSALPLSGSIYIWAAESAGPKYARFVGFMVAWWSCTAWMTFAASNSQVSVVVVLHIHISRTNCSYIQTTANYLVSILAVYEVNFPGGIDNNNVKWRAFIWILSEAFFFTGIAVNYLPRMLTTTYLILV